MEGMSKDLIISQLIEIDDLADLSRERAVNRRVRNIIDEDQGFFDRFISRGKMFPEEDVRGFLSVVYWDETKKNKFRLIFAPVIALMNKESILWALDKPFFDLDEFDLERLYEMALEAKEEELALHLLHRFPGRYDTTVIFNQAIHYGALGIVQLVLYATQDDIPDQDVTIDLFDRVILSGHTEILEEILLNHPRFDPSVWNSYPLIEAIKRRQVDMVRLLLDHSRVNPEVFIVACQEGNLEILQMLLRDSRVHLVPEGLFMAARWGNLEIVQFLSTLIDPSVQDSKALREAAWQGHLDIVDFLLLSGRVDPAARNNAAITLAASFGYADVVERLMAEPSVNPAEAFLSTDNMHVMEILLRDSRVDPTIDNYRKLYETIDAGDSDLLDFLLRKTKIGKNLPKIREALDYAVTRDEAECVRVMNSFLHTAEEQEAPSKQRRLIKVPLV